MKKLLGIVVLGLLLSGNAYAERLKCGSIFSKTIVELNNNSGKLDDVKYPDYVQKKNSSGWTWANIREIKSKGNEIFFLETIKNIDNNYIQQVNVFIINTKTLNFVKGVDKDGRKVRIGEYLADKFRGSKGKCKII